MSRDRAPTTVFLVPLQSPAHLHPPPPPESSAPRLPRAEPSVGRTPLTPELLELSWEPEGGGLVHCGWRAKMSKLPPQARPLLPLAWLSCPFPAPSLWLVTPPTPFLLIPPILAHAHALARSYLTSEFWLLPLTAP